MHITITRYGSVTDGCFHTWHMVCYKPVPMLLKLMSLAIEFTELWIRPWKKMSIILKTA